MDKVKIKGASVDKRLKARRRLLYKMSKTARKIGHYTKKGPGRYHRQGGLK